MAEGLLLGVWPGPLIGESMEHNRDVERLDGVYFHPQDHAGVGRRTLIALVDAAVWILMWVLVQRLMPAAAAFVNLGLTTAYFVVMKRSRLGTLGLILTDSKVTDLTGRTPTLGTMVYRMLLSVPFVLMPLLLLVDLLWLNSDKDKQSFRDKLAATYVVRRRARPAGQGNQRHVQYFLAGYTFMWREVTRDSSPSEPADTIGSASPTTFSA